MYRPFNYIHPIAVDTLPELRPLDESVNHDWTRLAEYLGARGLSLSLDPGPRQFAGGLANLNYLLLIDGKQFVLRRPPMGTLPPGAYDMAREFQILSRLSAGFPLAPRGLHLCSDPAILGAPFQIVEYRRGFTVRSALPAALDGLPGIGGYLAETLLSVMIQLHDVDPAAVGLQELGRPEGFLARTVEGWIKRALLSADGRLDSPCHTLISVLATWLRAHRVVDGACSLIHNDIKLDNIVLDGTTLGPVALLDWDQCTRGDRLLDLATALSYYSEASDPPVMHQLKQMPTACPGFPSRREVATRYASLTQRDLSDFKFYRVLAIFKLAVIFQQLNLRYRSGATQDARYANFGTITDGILEFAELVVRGEVF
jgi:aminoglycoside phosphotransferase (APT) family kinase protein